MSRIRLILTAVIGSLLFAASAAGAERAPSSMAEALAVTVQIDVERDPPAETFSGGRLSPRPPSVAPGRVAGQGGGSGFIFDAAGLIATNAHVVQGARTIAVRLQDGRRLPARVVGSDATLDLAVLRIDAAGPLAVARLADSREVVIGAAVRAIGAPLGYGVSVSSGILSGRDRRYDDRYAVRLLQHDAALNPGNSGGPLFDSRGYVIGVNTATPPQTLFDIGVGFAIPAEVAGPALRQLARDGRIERGRLGLSVTPGDTEVAAALGATRPGLLIDAVTDSGAARRSGLRAGDLVTAVADTPLTTPGDLSLALLDSRPGQTVRVAYVRDGQEATADIRLDGDPALTVTPRPSTVETPLHHGLTLGPSEWDGGVSVLAVASDSPAALRGIRAGDRLRAINGRTPADAADARTQLGEGRASVVLLRLDRAGEAPWHVVLPLTREAAAARPPGRVVDAVSGPF